uniref:FAD/NAD(P)-binding domain-containing protein n=1 Tax=Glossina austeni TaxID=7395 RepID=A0A1A9UDD1_GLOAU
MQFNTMTKHYLNTSKICIVGAGPAGFYAAQYLLKYLKDCQTNFSLLQNTRHTSSTTNTGFNNLNNKKREPKTELGGIPENKEDFEDKYLRNSPITFLKIPHSVIALVGISIRISDAIVIAGQRVTATLDIGAAISFLSKPTT